MRTDVMHWQFRVINTKETADVCTVLCVSVGIHFAVSKGKYGNYVGRDTFELRLEPENILLSIYKHEWIKTYLDPPLQVTFSCMRFVF